jgi:F0F1-type ATP synthase membrane subunit b/b'
VPVASSNRAAGGSERQTERAEHVVSDLERAAENAAARAGDWIARATDRLREEAEDIWAEAQAIRRRQ